MMVAARAPELIQCAAGLSGLYDLEAFATDSDTASTAYGRSYISRALGNDKAQWLANSPVHLAARIKAPVFLAHGEIDEIGRAHVCTPVTNAHLVCRLLL